MIPAVHPRDDENRSLYLQFLSELESSAFNGEVSADYSHRTVLATDNSVYQVTPKGVVYPRSNDDLVCLCELVSKPEYKEVVLSPRGGGTGTNGQSLSPGIIVDTSRHMNKILEVNVEERWARVQCGVVKDQLNAAIAPKGLFFAPELSTSNRATIGGMINTDASGQGSRVYGKTRDHVLELKTVLLDGSVIVTEALNEDDFSSISEHQDRSGLIHRVTNNIYTEHKQKIEDTFPVLNRCLTGYDLAHIRDENDQFNLNNILCGSEGTLGFITEAKINLLDIPKTSAIIVVKYADFENSLRDAQEIIKHDPTSVETIDSKVLNLAMKDFVWHQVEDFFADETPEPVQGINLVEFTADSEEQLDQAMQTLLSELEKEKIPARIGYALARGSDAVKRIVNMRKRSVGLLGNAEGEARPIPFVEDTAVPPENLADYIMEFRELLDSHGLKYGMFGHVDVGVLHVRPALDMKDPEHEKLAWEISDRVAELTQKYKGLLWGEHGKGVRSSYAPDFFGELYPQIQRIKAAFDPFNQLNPGKIATPSDEHSLLNIDEVNTRGELDRQIPVKTWTQFDSAVYCNGNGACHNWNFNDAMCPSWKATRLRTHTPKGRASLVKEWLRLLTASGVDTVAEINNASFFRGVKNFPGKVINAFSNASKQDFSHEVYDSMAGCLACKSCSGECPIKVDVPEFRSKFLALYHTRYFRPLKDYLVANLETLLPFFAKIPAVYNAVMGAAPIKYLLQNLAGFVDGPQISREKLNIEIADIKKLSDQGYNDRANTVVIVQDAFTRYFDTRLLNDIAELLETLGFYVYMAPYAPNGKPLHVHGFLKKFASTAKKNAKKLKAFNELGIALVGIDPSMTLTYRAEYRKYTEESENVDVMLLQEWLSKHHARLADWAVARNLPSRTYKLMPHCTEKTNATASLTQWQAIFKALGMELDLMALGCCGMAGTYGHEARNRDNSATIFSQSWAPAIQAENDKTTLLATGYSCRCQVQREENLQIMHPLQALKNILAENYAPN